MEVQLRLCRLRLSDLKVALGKGSVLPVGLFPEMQETVGVSARREGVELDRRRPPPRFRGSSSRNLPVRGRFYQTLLTLAPGGLDADEDDNPTCTEPAPATSRPVGGVANTTPSRRLPLLHQSGIGGRHGDRDRGAGAEFGAPRAASPTSCRSRRTNSFEGVAGVLWNTSRRTATGRPAGSPPYDWGQPSSRSRAHRARPPVVRLSHEWIDRKSR